MTKLWFENKNTGKNRNKGLTDEQKCTGRRLRKGRSPNVGRCGLRSKTNCQKCGSQLCWACSTKTTRHNCVVNHTLKIWMNKADVNG